VNRAIILLALFFLTGPAVWSQEVYDACSTAIELCPNQTYALNNIGAFSSSCANCEDDFNYCFSTDNTIWCSFTTNLIGGAVQVDFSNLIFETNAGQGDALQATIIQAGIPCDAGTYTQIGACLSNETGDFTLNAAGLNPSTLYYLVVDGATTGPGITSPAECSFEVTISGLGIDRVVPNVSISESSLSVCLNELVTFTCNLSDCPDTAAFLWYVNGDLIATTMEPTFQTSALTDGAVVTVETGCYSTCIATVQATSQAISVYTVFVDAGSDVTVSAGEEFNLNGSTTAPVFYWSPSFAVGAANLLNPSVAPTETTTYALTAEENGCVQTDYMTATVLAELEIPNTFSPNGDNLNDTWAIDGLDAFPNNSVTIFSRWGQKVAHILSYSNLKSWDGTGNMGRSPEGVYYYIIELNDGSDKILRGTLTLLR
jgi:gliding motility-associated-like protein